MGRDLTWYVLPSIIEHDKTRICSDLEFEPSREELEELEKHHKLENIMLEKWCPKCFMYAHGLSCSTIVKTSIHIHHSYSNPIWTSSWCIRKFYMGDSMTDFCKRFDSDRLYNEITEKHLRYTRDELKHLGEPIRTSDKEAYEETMKIIKFIEDNLHPDNMIIFDDEY
jgi:hypothetical protein